MMMKFATIVQVLLLASPVASVSTVNLTCVVSPATDASVCAGLSSNSKDCRAQASCAFDGSTKTCGANARQHYALVIRSLNKTETCKAEVWNTAFGLTKETKMRVDTDNTRVACKNSEVNKTPAYELIVGSESIRKSDCNKMAEEMNRNLMRRAPGTPLFSDVCESFDPNGKKGSKVETHYLQFEEKEKCIETAKVITNLIGKHFCDLRFPSGSSPQCSGFGTCTDGATDYKCTCNATGTAYDTIVGNDCQFTYTRTEMGADKSIMDLMDTDTSFKNSFVNSTEYLAQDNYDFVESETYRFGWVNVTVIAPESKIGPVGTRIKDMTYTVKGPNMPPGEFLINPKNGYMLAIPGYPDVTEPTKSMMRKRLDLTNQTTLTQTTNFTDFDVVVYGQRVDNTGTLIETELETIPFRVNRRVDFTCANPVRDTTNEQRCRHNVSGSCVYIVGESYSFGPIQKGKLMATGCAGAVCTPEQKEEELWFSLMGAPPGFLMDTVSGDLGGVPTRNGNYTMSVFAFHGEDTKAKETFIRQEVDVRHKHDIVCQPGSAVVPINKTNDFTCVCRGGFVAETFVLDSAFEGKNCETTPAMAKKEADDAESKAAEDAEALKTKIALAAEADKTKIALAGAGGLLLLIGIVFLAVKANAYRVKMKPANFDTLFQAMVDAGEIDSEEAATRKKLTPREIKRSHLNLVEVVGHGQFGEVWKGMLDETSEHRSYLVAAKTVLDAKSSPEATLELEQEAIVMAHVGGHPNLVSLIGVITRGDPLVLIISYCEHGSLLSLLRKRAKEGSPLYLEAKLKLGLDTAKGMAHLHSKHFVHRDLAARNVLVATGMVGQVADFGLSRGTKTGDGESPDEETEEGSTYYRSQSGIFPVRWTAPEAMESLKFSAASDIWSFAVTIVETLQDGAQPYEKKKNAEVMTFVMAGGKHDKPEECTSPIYTLLCECWANEPADRPDFTKCIKVLQAAHKKEKDRPRQKRRSTANLLETPGFEAHLVDTDGYLMPEKGKVVANPLGPYAHPPDSGGENAYTDFGFGGAGDE